MGDDRNRDVDLAIFEERQRENIKRIEVLERRLREIDRKVLTGQIAFIILAALGTFVGWLFTISEKIRGWFH